MGHVTTRITGFVDEISPDVAEQIAAAQRIGLHGIDVRSVQNINVLDLTPAHLLDLRQRAVDAGLTLQSVGSPVNKVAYAPEHRAGELDKLRRAIAAAKALGTERVRIFSPEWTQEGTEPDHGGLLDWMGEQVELAEDAGVRLIHENDAKFYGAYPTAAQRLMEALSGPHFALAYDAANTVLLGYRTTRDWLPWMMPYLDTIHVKDAIQAEGRIVPAGEGDGEWPDFLSAVIRQGWQGPLTLEPHLEVAGRFGGFSGEERFAEAARALRQVLTAAGGQWE